MVLDGDPVKLGDLIEAGRVHRYLALPEHHDASGAMVFPRSYADLRFITPVKPNLFGSTKRLASLTDHGQSIVWAKLLTFFSGRVLPASMRCPHCSTEFPNSLLTRLGQAQEQIDTWVPDI